MLTWLQPQHGGLHAVNFENPATQYRTGNEFHLEYFLGQPLPKGFALGPCLTFNGKIAGQAIGLNARYYNELKVINCLDGQSFFLTMSFGL